MFLCERGVLWAGEFFRQERGGGGGTQQAGLGVMGEEDTWGSRALGEGPPRRLFYFDLTRWELGDMLVYGPEASI